MFGIIGCKSNDKEKYIIYKLATTDKDLDFIKPIQSGRNNTLEKYLNNNYRSLEYTISFKDDYVLLENGNPNHKLVLSKEALSDPNQTPYYSGKGSKGKASFNYTLIKKEDGKVKLAVDCSYPPHEPIFIPVQLGGFLNETTLEFARVICYLSKTD